LSGLKLRGRSDGAVPTGTAPSLRPIADRYPPSGRATNRHVLVVLRRDECFDCCTGERLLDVRWRASNAYFPGRAQDNVDAMAIANLLLSDRRSAGASRSQQQIGRLRHEEDGWSSRRLTGG